MRQPLRAAISQQEASAAAQGEAAASGIPAQAGQQAELENVMDAPPPWMPRLEITRTMLGRWACSAASCSWTV